MAKNYFANNPMPSLMAFSTNEVAPEKQQGRFGDTVDAFQSGALSGIGGIFDFVGADGIAQSLYGYADEQNTQMSNRGREAMNKSFVQEDESGSLEFGEGATDLDTWLLTMANVAGQFASTAVPGAGAAGLASKAAGLGGKGKVIANAATMGATGGSAATGQGMEQARQEVNNMPDEVLAQSPLFADVLRGVHANKPELSADQKWDAAKKALSNKVAQEVKTDPKVLLANFGASAIGDPIIGKALTGARLAKSGALRSALAGFVTEGATESVQAGAQQYGINQALQPIDNRDPMKGVVSAGLNEGLAGGGFGGGAGLIGGIANRQQPEQVTPEPVTEPEYTPDPTTEKVKETNSTLGEAMESMDKHSAEIKRTVENFDIPAVARNAGATNNVEAGRFGDQFTSPTQEALKTMRNQTVADMVNEASNYIGPTPQDREVITGDVLPPNQSTALTKRPNYTGISGGFIEGESAQINGLLEQPEQPFSVPIDHALPSPTRQIEDKKIIFGDDNRPAQQQAEQAQALEKQQAEFKTKTNKQNLLPQKDIIFAGNDSGVNVATNGKPFKSEKEAKSSKLARKAKREGLNVEVVPFGNGYGWQVVNDNAQQESVVTEQPEVNNITEQEEKLPLQSEQSELENNQVNATDDIKGEMIDKEWQSFTDESGTKKIPRAEMPQIKAENRGAMVNFMNARDIKHEADEVKADTLKPTQQEFSPEKVKKAMNFEGGNRSILVSQDGYVLDGHHQWLAAREKNEKVDIIRLDAPIETLVPLAKEMPSTETQDDSKENIENDKLNISKGKETPVNDQENISTSKPSKENLPKILTITKNKWLKEQAKSNQLKTGSPGYKNAIDKIEATYEDKIDEALASTTFEEYNKFNADTPENINRQSYDALREDFGYSKDETPNKPTENKKPIESKENIKPQESIDDFGEKLDKETEQGTMLFSKSKPKNNAKGIGAKQAQSIADKFIKSLNGANGLKVKILQSNSEAEKLWRMSLAGSRVKGAYSDKTKTVYVIADNVSNTKDLKQTLAHETIAHGGLDTVFTPEQHKAFINRIRKTKGRKAFSQYWANTDKDYRGDDDNVKAEEIFARFVENEPTKGELKYWWNAFKRWIANQFSKLGVNLKEDTEIAAMREMMEAIVVGFKKNQVSINNMTSNKIKKSATTNTEKSFVVSEQEAKEQGYDIDSLLYSGSNIDSRPSKIQVGYKGTIGNNLFDGIFGSTSKSVAESHGSLVSRFVYKGNVAESADLDNDTATAFLKNHTWINDLEDSAFDDIYDAVVYDDDSFIWNQGDNLSDISEASGTYDNGELSWEMQRLRGQLAKKLGFDVVAMNDEHGTSYLMVGDSVKRLAEPEELSDIKFSRTADTRTAKEKLGLEDSVEETIVEHVKEKTKETISTLKSDSFWQRLNEGVFDGLSGIKQAEESVGIVDPNQQGYVSARLASGLADVLHGVFHFGAPKWQDGIIQRKEDTKGLLEVFGGLGDDLNNWLAWMGAQRAEKLAAEGKENNLTQADIDELKALASGKEEEFETARIEYNKINSAILDVAQEAGLLSTEQRGAFDEEYYVPFFRDMGETDPEMDDIKRMIAEPHSRRGIAGQTAQIKALKGGGQSTKDLLENIIARQSTLIDASLKNKAMMEVTDNLSGTDYMQAEESEAIANLSQTELNKLHRVKVMRNGKAEAYMVSDPSLLRALIHINDIGSKSLFNKIGRSAKRFLTAGITMSPDFIFKNFVRDAAHAWMVNKDGFKFGADSVKGLKKAFKEDETYRDLIFSGAAFQGGYIHGADPEAAAQQIRRALLAKGLTKSEVKSYLDSLVTNGAQLLEKYKNVSDKVENANRLSTYEAALNAGKSKRQAAYEAKDLMDYSLKGNFALIGTMIDMLPFFNARLQGISKLVRASKAGDNDRVLKVLSANLAMKGMKVAAFSLALAALNDEEDEYQELPDWDKDANWHFFVDGDHFRIPKPFELGIIFGTMPERMLHYGTGTQSGDDVATSVTHAIFSTLALNPIPQAALPIVETIVNKSFFMDSPVEGMTDENKQAQDRYSSYTSEVAKAIGNTFNWSPKKIDHLIKGYTGTIGGYVLGASDIVAHGIMGKETADAPVSRLPVVKAFYQGDGPKTNTKFANEFYEALEATKEAYGSYKRAMELGDTSRQQEIIEEDGDKLRSRIALNRIQRATSKLGKQARAVNDNNNLNGSQKRERLDAIQRQKNALYHQAYVAFNLGEW